MSSNILRTAANIAEGRQAASADNSKVNRAGADQARSNIPQQQDINRVPNVDQNLNKATNLAQNVNRPGVPRFSGVKDKLPTQAPAPSRAANRDTAQDPVNRQDLAAGPERESASAGPQQPRQRDDRTAATDETKIADDSNIANVAAPRNVAPRYSGMKANIPSQATASSKDASTSKNTNPNLSQGTADRQASAQDQYQRATAGPQQQRHTSDEATADSANQPKDVSSSGARNAAPRFSGMKANMPSQASASKAAKPDLDQGPQQQQQQQGSAGPQQHQHQQHQHPSHQHQQKQQQQHLQQQQRSTPDLAAADSASKPKVGDLADTQQQQSSGAAFKTKGADLADPQQQTSGTQSKSTDLADPQQEQSGGAAPRFNAMKDSLPAQHTASKSGEHQQGKRGCSDESCTTHGQTSSSTDKPSSFADKPSSSGDKGFDKDFSVKHASTADKDASSVGMHSADKDKATQRDSSSTDKDTYSVDKDISSGDKSSSTGMHSSSADKASASVNKLSEDKHISSSNQHPSASDKPLNL